MLKHVPVRKMVLIKNVSDEINLAHTQTLSEIQQLASKIKVELEKGYVKRDSHKKLKAEIEKKYLEAQRDFISKDEASRDFVSKGEAAKLYISLPISEKIDINNKRIINYTTFPTKEHDVTNKKYVDEQNKILELKIIEIVKNQNQFISEI